MGLAFLAACYRPPPVTEGPRSSVSNPGPNRAPVEALLVGTGLRLFLMGGSVCLALGTWFFANVEELALHNMMLTAERRILIGAALLAGLCTCILGAAYAVFNKDRAALRKLGALSRLASPLLLSFALPNLFNWRIYQGKSFLFAVLATLFGLALERTFRASHAAARELGLSAGSLTSAGGRLWRRLARRLPAVFLAAMVIGFAATMTVYTVRQHYQFNTYSWDLGIFNNLMYNLLRGHWFKASPVLGPEGSHIQFHATFGAYLLAPIYALWQTPEMLLAMQAALVAAAAIPLYFLARRRLNSAWLGVLFAYVYLVHAPLHGPLFYDFHFLTISPVFVLTVIYCFESRQRGWLIVAWLLAISIREEVSATLGVCALYYLLCGIRPRWAFWGGALSALYFLTVKFIVMPAHGAAGQSFSWIFQGLIAPGDAGFGGVLRTLATNPVFTFSSVFTAEKFEYLLRTLGPLLLLPVRRRLVWLLCLPAFVFTLLSTGYDPMVKTQFQYTANWTPYALFACILVLDGWRHTQRSRFVAALPALCVTATLFSYNFGAIFQHNTFMGGFHKVSFTLTPAQEANYNDLKNLIREIPDSAKVSACELIVPHVSSREDAYTLNRAGAGDADYLICGTDWLKQEPVKSFMKVALATGRYSFVRRSGMFAMWKKSPAHQHDAEGFKLLGMKPAAGSTPVPPRSGVSPPPSKVQTPAVTPSAPAAKTRSGGGSPHGSRDR